MRFDKVPKRIHLARYNKLLKVISYSKILMISAEYSENLIV